MTKSTIEWLNEAIFYEIYPQSFKDSNGDGIGDLKGIIEKLDYIKDLGCNALWINPCFISPFMDAGYDVEDYYKIAPRYGTNEDMIELCKEVHKRNMHILLDLVPGHTSYKHKWFKESSKAEKNEYTDRYVWTDSVWNQPFNYKFLSGVFERDANAIVNFFSSQPALNYGFYNCTEAWHQPIDAEGPKASRKELINIMRFWLEIGCDGFRVDMADSLVRNDPEHIGIKALWEECRAFLEKDFPEAVLISEIGNPKFSLDIGFHMDFLLHVGPSHYLELFREYAPHEGANPKRTRPYFAKDGKVDIEDFILTYESYCKETAGKGLICIPSGNHDMIRMADSLSVDEMKLAFAFIYSMPGAPFLYYGDEIGMRHNHSLVSKEGGYFRTGARTPMQWDNSKNCGFSSGDEENLYLPIDPDKDRPTLENQVSVPNSLYNTVKELISLRKKEKALGNCGTVEFLTKSGHPLAFVRTEDEEKALVIINTSDEKATYKTNIFGDEIYRLGNYSVSNDGYELAPCSAIILKIK